MLSKVPRDLQKFYFNGTDMISGSEEKGREGGRGKTRDREGRGKGKKKKRMEKGEKRSKKKQGSLCSFARCISLSCGPENCEAA